MGMGVMFEFLIPGVEHTEEADLGAEMLGIASGSASNRGSSQLNSRAPSGSGLMFDRMLGFARLPQYFPKLWRRVLWERRVTPLRY